MATVGDEWWRKENDPHTLHATQETKTLPGDQSRCPTCSLTFLYRASCTWTLFSSDGILRWCKFNLFGFLFFFSPCVISIWKTVSWFLWSSCREEGTFLQPDLSHTLCVFFFFFFLFCRVCFIASCLPEEAWLLSLIPFVRHVLRRRSLSLSSSLSLSFSFSFAFVSNPALCCYCYC